MVTQAFFHPPALARGLDLIADGKSASEVIDGLTDPSFDVAYERRQHGVVRLAGDFAAFTGAEATPEKGARSGAGSRLIWSVQGNTLTGVDVLDRSEAVMLASDGCDLAETLMRALEAGAEQSGGDARCRPESPAHSAFIQVDRVGEQAGDYLQISVVLSPGDDAVSELRSEFDVWRATHPCPTSADAGTEKPDGHADSGIPADAGDHVDVPESTRDDSQDSDGGCGCRFARARHHRNDGLVVFGLIVGGCAVRSRRSRRPAVSPSA